MTIPTIADAKTIWLGLYDDAASVGWLPIIGEQRSSETLVFDNRLTIGPANQDSDSLISTLAMGDWTGGGQIEEMSGATQSRYWWGIFDGLSPNQAALPPLVLSGKPSGATGTAYPLGVVNDTAYFAFGTDICGLDEANCTTSALAWYTKESMTNAPSGKCAEFNGKLYVPTGTNGYSVITESAAGNPVVTPVTGAADPTSNSTPPTSNPKAVHFAVHEGRKLFALTTTGGIAYSFTGDSNDWHWDYDAAEDVFPKLETSTTPRRLIPFFNRAGVPALMCVHSRGLSIYNRNLARFEETPVQFPQHPDVGLSAATWRPGEDLWIAMGLDTVKYTAANVFIPLSGVNRDAGVPPDYRGKIVDLEPGISALYALVSPTSDTSVSIAYSSSFGSAGSGNGQFSDVRQIAIDSSGNIFAADFGNDRFQKFNSSGVHQSNIITSVNEPMGVCVDSSDDLYVVYDGKLAKYDDLGSPQWDVSVSVGHDYVHVATDDTHVYYAVNNLDPPIRKRLCSDGSFVSSFGTSSYGSTYYTGITYNRVTGTLFVTSRQEYSVREYTTSGTFVRAWGSNGTGDGQFTTPWAITHHPVTGNLFVTDIGRDDVQEFTATGSFVRKFGANGTGNGEFSSSQGIAFNAAGDALWASDADNEDIQKFIYTTSTTSDNAKPHVQQQTGIGWHGIWEGTAGDEVTLLEATSVTNGYRLSWGSDNGNIYSTKLDRSIRNPAQSITSYTRRYASTGYIETSRTDMGMLGFKKIASHVIAFTRYATADEYIKVQYEVDNSGWLDLGNVTSTGKTTLPFREFTSGSETSSRGIAFEWIRLRLNFYRGASNITLSPVLRAINLHFLKVPQSSKTFNFTVPLPREMFNEQDAEAIRNRIHALAEADEMIFLRYHDTLYRGRLAQVSTTDMSGQDFSGTMSMNFVEIPTNED